MWGLGYSGQPAAAVAGGGSQQARCFAFGSGGGAWAKGRRTKMAAIRNKDGAADTGPQLRVNGDITGPVVRLVHEDGTHQVRHDGPLQRLVLDIMCRGSCVKDYDKVFSYPCKCNE